MGKTFDDWWANEIGYPVGGVAYDVAKKAWSAALATPVEAMTGKNLIMEELEKTIIFLKNRVTELEKALEEEKGC